MDLLDLLTEDEWNGLSQEMHALYGISFGISDTAGARVSSYANWCNRLCPKIKSNPEALAAVCAVAAQHFTEMTRQTRKPLIGECDLGLLKIAVPIFAGDTFLGTAGGCGFAREKGDIDTFLIRKVTGMDEADADALVKDILPMSDARAMQMTEVLTAKISEIVNDYERSGHRKESE